MSGDVVSWWRFEEDTDASADGLSNPNEIALEPALVSDNATLGNQAPDLFDTFIPGTDIPNTSSVLAANNGSNTDGIFGEAAYSSTLDVSSITVEFWVRTTENEAGFVARTTSDNTGESGTISDGFRIVDPESVRVDFVTAPLEQNLFFPTDDPRNYATDGGVPVSTTIDSGIAINDGEWHYIAFRYDAATREASLTVDDSVTSTTLAQQTGTYLLFGFIPINYGYDNQGLYWGDESAEPVVTVGNRLDGDPNNETGTIDEIRFSDEALDDSELLTPPIPEPGTLLAGALLCGFAMFSMLKGSSVWKQSVFSKRPVV